MKSPTEAQEQATLIEFCARVEAQLPELALLFHIPNGGERHKAVAAQLKAQGVKAGVPDLFLPVARGMSHGLWIELKRRDGGTLSAAQIAWRDALQAQGYYWHCCHGWEEAARIIIVYLGRNYRHFGL